MVPTPRRLAALLGLALTACAPAIASHSAAVRSTGSASGGTVLAAAPRLSLQAAMRRSRDQGPLPASTPLQLDAVLAERDAAGLDALLARGVHVTPGQYAARFGPDPSAVDAARSSLRTQGLVLD